MPNNQRKLADVSTDHIQPYSRADAKSALADLKEIGKSHPDVQILLSSDSPFKSFLVNAFSLSPYLRDTARIHPDYLVRAITLPVEDRLKDILREASTAWKPETGTTSYPIESVVMTRLRKAKREASFLIALADLSRIFEARETTFWLSELAEACASAAIDHLLFNAHEAGKLVVPDPENPSDGSGLIVLGMGKLGARELNYSSDIDLVVFFDPERRLVADPMDATETLSRLVRRLIRILQERTGDGYVFRTDLRLRPDPGATPLAIPLEAALLYYESRGQNWERAAYIKARPVAGDRVAGAKFLAELTPFVFRKYLDYAAIADIHSIKRQIHAHKGHGKIAVKGHNVKLGRGGIREIEFFVQTQQLIAGGRMPALRLQSTEAMLKGLAAANWIDRASCDELISAYWFLRDVEHRIQMVHDEQSHNLPDIEPELKRIALMMGFPTVARFSDKLVSILKTVEMRYARLFEQESKLSTGEGNLVFTGQNDDPDTIETLAKLGFERPSDISRTIRTWHYGRYRATQSVEARERLTELTPELLTVFGASKRADDALLRFDQFISGLPAGIQLFSLLGNNPGLLSLIVTIMSSAPRLASIIAAKPHVFDGMLDPGLLAELPTRAYLQDRIEAFLSGATHYEDILDRLRIINSEQRFLIGIRLLTGSITGAQAGRAFTHLADIIVETTLAAVMREMRSAHGDYPGGRIAIIGVGKLGSYELTAGSDIDLILLYDYDDDAIESDGPKPLDSTRYFTRITQRLIAALSAPTAEGILYEVDMRLRPSGNKGPVATRIRSFEKYQKEEAWTWEHMALTRARVICGEATISAEAEKILQDILRQNRDIGRMSKDIIEMRSLIDQEKPPKDIWDLKLVQGGLVDLEFIAQYLVLIVPNFAGVSAPTSTETARILSDIGPTFIEANDLMEVTRTLSLLSELSQIIRLCIEGPFDPAEAPAGLLDLVCRAADVPDIKIVEAELKRLSKTGRKIFYSVVTAQR